MTICDYKENYGDPPSKCPDTQRYLETFIQMAQEMQAIKHGTGTTPPTTYQLDQLWAPCDPPSNAVSVWHDTVAGTISQWVKTATDAAWIQFTNTPYVLSLYAGLVLPFFMPDLFLIFTP